MKYSELTEQQKAISNKLESIFLNSVAMTKYDFSTALAYLLNKHKVKKGDKK